MSRRMRKKEKRVEEEKEYDVNMIQDEVTPQFAKERKQN